MHELSIAQNLVRIASETAAQRGAGRVLRLEVRLGALAGVQTDALSFCFPVAAKATVCEGATLQLTVVPALGTCGQCGGSCEVSDPMAPCPTCDAWPLLLEGGSEMTLRCLEVS